MFMWDGEGNSVSKRVNFKGENCPQHFLDLLIFKIFWKMHFTFERESLGCSLVNVKTWENVQIFEILCNGI